MALSIKNSEVEDLAKRLARLKKTPITEAVRQALSEAVERENVISKFDRSSDRMTRAMKIIARSSARPIISTMTEDEILGYDEHGAPTR
jgi:antitoxin VapB